MSGKSTISIRDRFDRHVVRSTETDCWLWTASTNACGYGFFRTSGRTQYAHRVAYELANGQIAEGLVVRHKCDRPSCVRPSHLETGSMKDNTGDMLARGRDGHGEVRGEAHPGHVLRDVDVAVMRYLRACGVRLARLSALYGVSQARVSQICLGRAWTHVSALEAP